MAISKTPTHHCLVLVEHYNPTYGSRFVFYCRPIPARLFDPKDLNLGEQDIVHDVGDIKFHELWSTCIQIKNGSNVIATVTSNDPDPYSRYRTDTTTGLHLIIGPDAPVSMRTLQLHYRVDFSEILKAMKKYKYFAHRLKKL